MWISEPSEAWRWHILPHTKSQTWIEDSSDISEDLKLSNSELLALVIMTHMLSGRDNAWHFRRDEVDGEPNDGFVADSKTKISIECKLIPQMSQGEVLSAILGTYEKYRPKGSSYGQNHTLIIHANKGTRGMIIISELGDAIQENCPFEPVLFLSCCTVKGPTAVMHITQHFPKFGPSKKSGAGMTQVNIDHKNGEADVPHVGFKMN